MADTVKAVLKNSNPSSKAEYKIMSRRSDGRLPDKKVKPSTKTDKLIHNDHIVDSGQYNLRHTHDHLDELAFDYQRLCKEGKEKESEVLQNQVISLLNPLFKKLHVRLEKIDG